MAEAGTNSTGGDWNRLKKFLRDSASWIGRAFSGSIRSKKHENESGGEPPKFVEGMMIASADGPKSEELVDAQLIQVVDKTADYFWQAGYEDGKKSQDTNSITEMSKECAGIIQIGLTERYQNRIAGIEADLAAKKKFEEHAHQKYDETRQYHSDLQERFRRNPRRFSTALGVMYLVVMAVLLISDIPLALKLTQRGFDLDLGDIELQQFFIHPIYVVQQNWEVFLLAIGVSLCTFFVKIYWDKFVEGPPACVPEGEVVEPLSRGRRMFYHVVLGLCIGTIVCLGLFRNAWIDEGSLHESSSNLGSLRTVATSAPIDSTGMQSQSDADVRPTRHIVTIFAFVLITLLFPVVGGVCASLGLNYLHSRKELSRAGEDRVNAEGRYIESCKDLQEAQLTKEIWQTALKRYAESEFLERLAGLFSSYYTHGYQRGVVNADVGSVDVYEQALGLRGRMVYHMFSRAIQTSSMVGRREGVYVGRFNN